MNRYYGIMNHEFATKTSGLLDSTTFGYDVGGVPLGTFRPPYLEPVKTQFLIFFLNSSTTNHVHP